MRKIVFVLAGLTAVGVLAARADAQQSATARRPPTPPRAAAIAPAPPPPPAPVTNATTGPGTTLTGIVLRSQVVAAALVPVFVTDDGRVFGDFGIGFEPVVRLCSAAVLTQHGFAPTGATAPPPPGPSAAGRRPPAAASGIAGLAPVPPPPQLISVPSVAATAACWGGVNAGRIVVIR